MKTYSFMTTETQQNEVRSMANKMNVGVARMMRALIELGKKEFEKMEDKEGFLKIIDLSLAIVEAGAEDCLGGPTLPDDKSVML